MGGSNDPAASNGILDPSSPLEIISGYPGVYGQFGAPSAQNMPGGRRLASGWTDSSGNLWLAGGAGFDVNFNYNPLNDVWKFSPATNKWSWMGGTSSAPLCAANWNDTCGGVTFLVIDGSAGTLGIAAAGNLPQLFSDAGAWTDKGGNFWLFPGAGGLYPTGWDNVWEFGPSANEWTWIGGSPSSDNPGPVGGTYGTQGTPAASNSPGTLSGPATWTDNQGNLWLFGGNAIAGDMNNLWEYQPSAPAPVPSFAVFVLPATGTPNGELRIPAGTSGTVTTNVVAADGFNSAVALAASNLPTGVTASFNPASITGTGSSQMTVSTNYALNPENYSLTVTGTSGGTTATTTALLALEAAPSPTFTFDASPTSLTVNSGSQGTVDLTITPQYGFNSVVSFSCSNLPTGASCSFNPTTVTPSGQASTTQLTIAVAAQAAALRKSPRPVFPLMALAVLLCLLPFRTRRLQMLRVAMVLTALLLTSGCGGGSSGGGGGGSGGGGPTPVTSTITVLASGTTSSNLNVLQTTTVSLTVN